MVKVKIKKINENAIIPTYATDGSAAVDLYATSKMEMPETAKQNEQTGQTIIDMSDNVIKVHTGIAMSIPKGYVGLIVPRSSTGIKGMKLANGTGVIDSDYRGEIIVCLQVELRARQFNFSQGDRIAQMLFVPVEQAEFDEVLDLDSTERGTGGFGSTGI